MGWFARTHGLNEGTCAHAKCKSKCEIQAVLKVCAGERPPVDKLMQHGCPAAVVALLHKLWQADPADRPTMVEAHDVLAAEAAHGAEQPAVSLAPAWQSTFEWIKHDTPGCIGRAWTLSEAGRVKHDGEVQQIEVWGSHEVYLPKYDQVYVLDASTGQVRVYPKGTKRDEDAAWIAEPCKSSKDGAEQFTSSTVTTSSNLPSILSAASSGSIDQRYVSLHLLMYFYLCAVAVKTPVSMTARFLQVVSISRPWWYWPSWAFRIGTDVEMAQRSSELSVSLRSSPRASPLSLSASACR